VSPAVRPAGRSRESTARFRFYAELNDFLPPHRRQRDVAHAFSRCLACNGGLAPAAKAAVDHRLPPGTRRTYDAFWRCAGCGRIYWRGAHWARLKAMVARWCGTLPPPPP
jgi:uncharacterized protein with PIN domain